MNWIVLTHVNNDIGKMYMNLDHIIDIYEYSGETKVYIAGGGINTVKESLSEIKEVLAQHLLNPKNC